MGFTKGQALAALIGLSTMFGAIGYFGWYWAVPESVLFYAFLITFALYCSVMQGWSPLFRVLGGRLRDSQT